MEEKKTRVYLCENSLEGILSAVHEAYFSRYGHPFIQIQEKENYNYNFFYDYIETDVDWNKAESVADSIIHKISMEAWNIIKTASMHERSGKAQDIYRFLNFGYQMGRSVLDYLQEDHVRRVIYDSRTVRRETDRLMGFTRFQELKDGTLFGRIGPKHNQVPLLAVHFEDRLPEERWILYDERRVIMAVHEKGKKAFLMKGQAVSDLSKVMLSREELQIESWWEGFFHAIGIKERTNKKLQQQMMPKYYQRYMNFSSKMTDYEKEKIKI
ncbi:MAG: TIGR03915 family putative DNA repair protein [Lachnospiraceae bacterium]|nr:TIGR03915 family putative DNA repair protein [Lachnospiraceae bacterium]